MTGVDTKKVEKVSGLSFKPVWKDKDWVLVLEPNTETHKELCRVEIAPKLQPCW